MKKLDIKEFKSKPFTLYDEDWALVTAGTLDNHNSMTISWGGMGTLWSKDVVTVYIKPRRYTHEFMENNDFFVVSFFKEEYREALNKMGSLSGKNTNKDLEAKLTPVEYKGTTIYKEASVIFICKKIYHQDLDVNNMPKEPINTYYKVEKPHTMYIGEVIEILENE